MYSIKTETVFYCRDILKVTKVSQLKFVATEDLVQIGLSKPEQRRYKKIYTKYFPNPYISKIKKLLSSKRNEAVSFTFHSYIYIPFIIRVINETYLELSDQRPPPLTRQLIDRHLSRVGHSFNYFNSCISRYVL